MIKKSKRLNTLFKRRSLLKKPSIRRKSKKNIRFIKRGGEINMKEVAEKLNKINEIREEKGDFEQFTVSSSVAPLSEFDKGLEKDPKTGELTDESRAKLLAYYRANIGKKTTDVATWVSFGKQEILHNMREISRFTDDIIMILLKDYDLNSAKMIFMNNIFGLKPSMIQQYLPSNMWSTFGGVNRFTNWISKMVDPILMKGREPTTIPKLPIMKHTLSIIMTQLKDKYPRINIKDAGIRDLILNDLFKKMYYLKNSNSSQEIQLGGGGEGLYFLVTGGLILICAATTYAKVRSDVKDTKYDILRLQQGLPPLKEKTAEWRETLESDLQGVTKAKNKLFSWDFQIYDEDYKDAYRNFRLKQLEQTRLADIDLLTHGARSSSEISEAAERSWRGEPLLPKHTIAQMFADSDVYRNAFIGDKVAKYEGNEAELRNQMDRDNELMLQREVTKYENDESKIRNQIDRDRALMSQGIRPTSAIFEEAERARINRQPIKESDRIIADSEFYKPDYQAYEAKKTSDKVYSGLFTGFGV